VTQTCGEENSLRAIHAVSHRGLHNIWAQPRYRQDRRLMHHLNIRMVKIPGSLKENPTHSPGPARMPRMC